MTSLEWYKSIMPEMFEMKYIRVMDDVQDDVKKDAEDWIERNKPVQVNWEDSDNDTDEERERRIAELEALLFGK